MPNLDGLQSTKLIREIGFDAPIVALTAFAEESNVRECLDSGMNYFLSKPIRRPALKKVLNQYCSTIQEVDEDATTPPSPKHVKPKRAPVSAPPPTHNGRNSPAKVRRSIDSIEMGTTAGGTTVIVVSSGSRESARREASDQT